jgi:AcrR family transcriptional regulator
MARAGVSRGSKGVKAVKDAGTAVNSARYSIIDVAMRLFGEQGYSGTGMRDIATEVGLLPGSLYAHFASKEALLIQIVEAGIHMFLTAVEPHVVADKPAEERLRAMIRSHLEVVASNPQRSQVVFHQWRYLGDVSRAVAVEKRRRYEKAFVKVLQDGVRNGEFVPSLNPRITVLTILGALNWTPEWYSPKGPASPAELGDLMADALLGGLLIQSKSVSEQKSRSRIRKSA